MRQYQVAWFEPSTFHQCFQQFTGDFRHPQKPNVDDFVDGGFLAELHASSFNSKQNFSVIHCDSGHRSGSPSWRGPRSLLCFSGIALIVLADWRIQPNISLGMLYIILSSFWTPTWHVHAAPGVIVAALAAIALSQMPIAGSCRVDPKAPRRAARLRVLPHRFHRVAREEQDMGLGFSYSVPRRRLNTRLPMLTYTQLNDSHSIEAVRINA